MAVELGRTWCVRHGLIQFARLFRQQRRSINECLIGMVVRGGRRHHEPHYGAVSVRVWRELCRQDAGFDDEEGEHVAWTGGEETDWTLPEREFLFFRSAQRATRSMSLVVGRR